ncbi:response regulator [Spirosoma taeanense]|uniref:Response regulator n=1 Tax=Spirosoma taeanense TaxID=2735870 RepID=A0A6M5Y8S0_9BACT|nr:response regulator [Spirosoma taeanense]QJW89650.1 response regulator [Spirosoma taeanense]
MTYLGNCQKNHLLLPDLILLDLYLPERERGWWVLTQIRRHAALQSLPIVILSRWRNPFVGEESYWWGANSYICKLTTAPEWMACFEARHQHWRTR